MKRITKIMLIAMTLALAVCMVAVMAACNQPAAPVTKDGSATTNYKGTDITISVKVTVENSTITAIEIVDGTKAATGEKWQTKFDAESANVINSLVGKTVDAVNALTTSFVAEENTLEVVATGATISSNLLVKAVQDALSK